MLEPFVMLVVGGMVLFMVVVGFVSIEDVMRHRGNDATPPQNPRSEVPAE